MTGSKRLTQGHVTEVRRKQRLYSRKMNQYWEAKITDCRGKPIRLWTNLNSVLHREKSSATVDGLSAESFSKAFASKVDDVRTSTAASSPPHIFDLHAELIRGFDPVDVATVQRLVTQATNKNCELDPVLTWLVKQFVNELSPFITLLFNASFRDGIFPSSLKCAVVTPALKKSTLDPSDANNYRPVSNPTFISWLLNVL